MTSVLVFCLYACIASAVESLSLSHRFASANTTFENVSNTSANQQGFIVCQCDGMGTCEDHSMSKEDELFLCVFTKSMEIADIQTLTFRQGKLILSTIVEGHKDEYTWITKDTTTQCTIRTRLHRDFFKPSFRGAKRNSLIVDGMVIMEDNIRTEFQIEIQLKSSRLMFYVSKHSYVIAFFVLIFIAIGVWAVIVTMASASRTRPDSSVPEKLVELEEKRFVDIYTIWYQSDRGKRSHESCSRTESSKSSGRLSSRAEQEEKHEIEPYDKELVSYMPSLYAVNRT